MSAFPKRTKIHWRNDRTWGNYLYPHVFPRIYLIILMLFWKCPLMSEFFFWFSLVSIAPGPSLCLLSIIAVICLASHALPGESHRPLTDGCEFSPCSQKTSRYIYGYMYVVRPVLSDKSPRKFPLLPSGNLPALLPFLHPPCMPPTASGMWFVGCTKPGVDCGCFYCATMSALFSHPLFSAAKQSADSHVLDKNRLLAKTLTSNHSPVS